MRAASEGASAPVVGVRAHRQSSRSVLDSLHRQVKRLAPLLTNLSATVWFAVVESRSKCSKVKAVDVMHAYLMPTWSKCECC